jgi:hypothetical protein
MKMKLFANKKIFALGLALALFFSLAACNTGLEDYKTTKKTEIATYATSKGQENYTTENWAAVDSAVESGKTLVDTAENKVQVNTAVEAAKDAIDRVSRKLKGWFEASNGEPASKSWCAFTSDESRLKVDKCLIAKLFYGTEYDYPADLPSRFRHDGQLPTEVLTEISMAHGIYTRRLPQKGEYTYGKSEYIFEYEGIEGVVLKEIHDFGRQNYPNAGFISASETVVIPAEWFVGEMGGIVWTLVTYGVWPEGIDRNNAVGIGVGLYYRTEGEDIILFDSYYNFCNDIRN